MPLSGSFPPLSSALTGCTLELPGVVKIEERKSVLGGFRTCQTVLLGAVGMKEEVGWRGTFLGALSKK